MRTAAAKASIKRSASEPPRVVQLHDAHAHTHTHVHGLRSTPERLHGPDRCLARRAAHGAHDRTKKKEFAIEEMKKVAGGKVESSAQREVHAPGVCQAQPNQAEEHAEPPATEQ